MSIFHDVPTPLSFANKKNKMELVKLVKDVPKDIIDGTGACPVKFRRTVQRISLGRFTQFNPKGLFNRGSKKQKRNAQIQPRPPFPEC